MLELSQKGINSQDEIDISLAIAIGSATQIALFVPWQPVVAGDLKVKFWRGICQWVFLNYYFKKCNYGVFVFLVGGFRFCCFCL